MLKCGGRSVGCGCDRTTEISSSTCSSVSSLAEPDEMVGKKRLEISKQNSVSAFLASLSPRNLFKGLRKSEPQTMPKAERYLMPIYSVD
ncbi:hypothetical protein O3M35_006045 [Rhynocoris fuscipes]|uniref:Uncharacterized protein n=1 Tax=Rhynocoris fuscipes TaxID=488301 RepID=A0AAW1DH63_9HEMI